MKFCKYCNQPALYPPKTKWGGWCCSSRFYDCIGYRTKLKDTAKPWNIGLTVDTDERVKKLADKAKGKVGNWKGKIHSDYTKSLISSKMMGNRNANHRGDRQSYYNGIRMDSKWEVGAAKYFDSIGIDWKYNERGYELSDGRFYYPDFFIYENGFFKQLIEVKGYFRKENRKKFELFLLDYPEIPIELWQRDELFQKGIINKSGYTK